MKGCRGTGKSGGLELKGESWELESKGRGRSCLKWYKVGTSTPQKKSFSNIYSHTIQSSIITTFGATQGENRVCEYVTAGLKLRDGKSQILTLFSVLSPPEWIGVC